MKNLMVFRSMCSQAWSDFTKHFMVIVLLTACFVGINLLSSALSSYWLVFDAGQISLDLVIAQLICLVQACLVAIAYLFFMQHILDIVYARKIMWLHFSTAMLHAFMVDTVLYYIARTHGMPLYFPSDLLLGRSLQQAIEEISQRFDAVLFFAIVLSLIVASFLLMFGSLLIFRCLFIDLFIIEAQCSIKQAFNKSWDLALGHGRLYFVCMLVPVLVRSAMLCGVDYFAGAHEYVMIGAQIIAWLIFAYSLLLRAHLFKTLRAQETNA